MHEQERSHAGHEAGRRPVVLLIEDDEILATVASELLAPLAEVRWVASAEDAAVLAPTVAWDAIVTDIELPGRNGLDLLRELRETHPRTATLILSGHASFDYAVAAIRAGADDYMTKPIDPPAFVAKVSELIAATRARRAAAHESVLAIGAHPDDVEIGCGGVLAGHVAAGHTVTILTLTGGEAGGETAQRAAESEQAAALLGARLFHFELADTSVSEGAATISAIKRVIDEVEPTTIYTHTRHDVHQDHRNVHHATLVAARGLPRIYCYQAPSTTIDFHPTRFVPIDEQLEAKLEAIHAYASQVKVRSYLEEDLLRATARYWGRFAKARYVEPFEVVRDADREIAPAAAARGLPGAAPTESLPHPEAADVP